MILFLQVRRPLALASVWLLLVITEWGPRAVAGGRAASEVDQRETVTAVERLSRAVVRHYDVREDQKTGRLKRVLVRRVNSSRMAAGHVAPKNEVVQGSKGRPSAKTSEGQVSVDELVQQAGRRYGVDPKLIHAVIRQESNYNPFAVSRKGARGLMQLIPETADRFGVSDIFDPAENVAGGVKYLRHLLDLYDGDRQLTLAAYNAGEAAVERAQGIPPYPETEDYVSRVSRFYAASGRSASSERAEDDASNAIRPRIVVYVETNGLIRFETESK